jgi:hypothetical protein
VANGDFSVPVAPSSPFLATYTTFLAGGAAAAGYALTPVARAAASRGIIAFLGMLKQTSLRAIDTILQKPESHFCGTVTPATSEFNGLTGTGALLAAVREPPTPGGGVCAGGGRRRRRA